jgi:hypothetical protein
MPIDLDELDGHVRAAAEHGYMSLDVRTGAALVAELRAAREVVEAAARQVQLAHHGNLGEEWHDLTAALADYDRAVTP